MKTAGVSIPLWAFSSLTLTGSNSEIGDFVGETLDSFQDHIESCGSFCVSKSQALEELVALYEEASENNWDGEESLKVDYEAFEKAFLLLESMPETWEKPEIDAEPDGEISIEWYVEPYRRISVSMGKENRIAYAWLKGDEFGNAVEKLAGNSFPSGLLFQADRILS